MAAVAEEIHAGSSAGRATQQRGRSGRRRWGPIKAVRGVAQGLTSVVRAPARRLRNRNRRGMASMSSQLMEPALSGGTFNQSFQFQQHLDWLTTTVAGGLGRLVTGQQQQNSGLSMSAEERGMSRREFNFPEQLCVDGSCQELAATGHRTWGSWKDGRGLLQIKIYDFALYVDKDKARRSEVGSKFRHREFSDLRDDRQYYNSLRSAPDINMSLLVRTNHVLPIGVMAREYERILRKRITLVGGDRHDPDLNTMLDYFKESNLPEHVKWGPGSVRKGTVLTFRRTGCGGLAAKANHEDLGEVPSQQVAAALFDLYLGDNPVHHKAKRVAGQKVHEIISNAETPVHSLIPKLLPV
uniref:Chalcone isomerase domain-containing protein n=1 Tax=Tetraselmis chuii TaxID=63592 RepID=A0A7S1X0F4_9CHLO|mmetsp:Transcript_17963/g.31995  ORF Transcript_17963/g.31995 Transcript_17963/m.31995 type:complete len:354 (+) Transcript_17963:253-1314(+)|eukprot:CAMPEP_0177767920 /NCGR_PEP_ID=MMETSP0491_2-20121128/9420_1 /TAXON_ID=63592 /ORGANISM="Tetraselmis chuii, Strain PLY429" /LENGTH=353 /DNA_ID=CAMNT_0019284643 /DNA_START=252 /DNA_END=1313 /DNA_ORIENTATION=+